MLNHLNSVACLSFLIGSILFLPPFANYAVTGVWCFICGSGLMLLASLLQTKVDKQQAEKN